MPGVELATLPIGVLWFITGSGVLAPAAGATARIYQHVVPPAVPTVPIQVYADEGLTIPMTQPLLADSAGTLPGYVDAPATGDVGQIFDVVASFSGVTLNPVMGNAIRGDTAMGGGGSGVVLGSLADRLLADHAQNPLLPGSVDQNFALDGSSQTVGVFLDSPPSWMDTNARILVPGIYSTGILADFSTSGPIPANSGKFVGVQGNVVSGLISLDVIANVYSGAHGTQGFIETFAVGTSDVPWSGTMSILLANISGAVIAITPFIQRLAH